MFNLYEPTIKATIAFLELIKVRVNKFTVNETLQNHPDWPSLLCISDSLNKWHIPNGAGKIDVNSIDELPTPFIAYTNNREKPLAIVTEVSGNSITILQKNYNKAATESREGFLKNWTGVYLIAEPTAHSGEPNYKINRRKGIISSLIPVSAIALLITLSYFLLRRTITVGSGVQFFNVIAIYLQYFILLAGVAVTSLLLWYEIDKNNPVLQKVCTGIAKGNCNAILSGKQSKLFGWLSWSEVGFFYFTGSLLIILSPVNVMLSTVEASAGLIVVAWLNILALPYTAFSVYYQWLVAKQWCVLCLVVQALLLLGGINVIVNNLLFPLSSFTPSLVANCLLYFLLPALLWYAAKPFILRLQEAKNTKREYLRIKFNAEIFETLLKKQKQVTVPTEGLGIDLGNPAAANTLIKVCNPYCGPCAKAHPEIEKLLEENENLKVKIIFTTPNKPEHPSFMPVSHLLAITEQGNNEIIKKSLDDWYLAEKKDYTLFAAKYPMNGELAKQGNKIEAMDKWCNEMKIEFTSTIFINGNQLPDAYNITDLNYFLLDDSPFGGTQGG